MKILILLLLTIVSNAVIAMPSVGDKVTYKIRIDQNGAYIDGKYEIEIIEKTRKDNEDFFTVLTTVAMEGDEPNVFKKSESAQGFQTEIALKEIIKGCESQGGKKGTHNIQDKTLETCTIISLNDKGEKVGETIVAVVPFSVVKNVEIIPSIERVSTIELISFKIGQE